MTLRHRKAVLALAVLGVLLGVRAAIGITHDGGDYETQAGPALDALVRGDVNQFYASYPVLGPLTVALRAPVVALLFHADLRVVYLAGAAVCFVALLPLGLWLARQVRSMPDVAAATLLLVVANPLTFRVVHWGHPEDYVAAAGIVASALALLRERPRLAGLLFGLAFASKQWAILAGPVLLVAARPRLLAFAGPALAVSVALYLPLAVGNPGHFVSVMKAASNPQAFDSQLVSGRHADMRAGVVQGMTHTTPVNMWWPVAVPHAESISRELVHSRLVAKRVVVLGHGLAALAALLIALVLARRGPTARVDVLLALALVFLLRCLLDPLDFDYHHLAFYLSLVAWESYSLRRPPVLSAAVGAVFGVMLLPASYSLADLYRHAGFLNAVYLAWAVPLAVGLAARLAGRGVSMRTYVRRWSSASSSTDSH